MRATGTVRRGASAYVVTVVALSAWFTGSPGAEAERAAPLPSTHAAAPLGTPDPSTRQETMTAAEHGMAIAPSRPPAHDPADVALPADSGTGRRVVYSVSRQRVWTVLASGRVARTYPVSGQPSQPDPGTFHVYSRARHTSSAVGAETMEFMVRFTYGERTGAPIGFHTIPVDPAGRPVQTVAQLGEPLSAGCIRQRRSDAVYLWRFAPVGTKVVVVA